MSNILGKNLTLTLFGESHGEAIGAILDGLPGGVKIDRSYMQEMMDQRKAVGSLSTGRHEADEVQFLSGVKDGYSEGTPIALVIANTNVKRKDYDALKDTARPCSLLPASTVIITEPQKIPGACKNRHSSPIRTRLSTTFTH